MSAFKKWFKEQYGRVPNADRLRKLRMKYDDLLGAKIEAERAMDEEERLHRQFNDALLGWNAKSHDIRGEAMITTK